MRIVTHTGSAHRGVSQIRVIIYVVTSRSDRFASSSNAAPNYDVIAYAVCASVNPACVIPASVVPTYVVPANVVPANVAPANVVPANVVPANVVPANVVPANVVPANVVPANVVPIAWQTDRQTLTHIINGSESSFWAGPSQKYPEGTAWLGLSTQTDRQTENIKS